MNAPTSTAPVCAPGEVDVDAYADTFATGPSAGWARTTRQRRERLVLGERVQPVRLRRATTRRPGDDNLWGDDPSTTSDTAIAMTTSVTVPAQGAHLRMRHAFGFDDTPTRRYDGGVLEYSTNAGATWTDAGSLMTEGGYNGTISGNAGVNNPLGPRPAFVRESNGYGVTRLDLSSLAGQQVRFRLRIGTGPSVGDYGWFVDDLRIYRCRVPDLTPPQTTIDGGRRRARRGRDADVHVLLVGARLDVRVPGRRRRVRAVRLAADDGGARRRRAHLRGARDRRLVEHRPVAGVARVHGRHDAAGHDAGRRAAPAGRRPDAGAHVLLARGGRDVRVPRRRRRVRRVRVAVQHAPRWRTGEHTVARARARRARQRRRDPGVRDVHRGRDRAADDDRPGAGPGDDGRDAGVRVHARRSPGRDVRVPRRRRGVGGVRLAADHGGRCRTARTRSRRARRRRRQHRRHAGAARPSPSTRRSPTRPRPTRASTLRRPRSRRTRRRRSRSAPPRSTRRSSAASTTATWARVRLAADARRARRRRPRLRGAGERRGRERRRHARRRGVRVDTTAPETRDRRRAARGRRREHAVVRVLLARRGGDVRVPPRRRPVVGLRQPVHDARARRRRRTRSRSAATDAVGNTDATPATVGVPDRDARGAGPDRRRDAARGGTPALAAAGRRGRRPRRRDRPRAARRSPSRRGLPRIVRSRTGVRVGGAPALLAAVPQPRPRADPDGPRARRWACAARASGGRRSSPRPALPARLGASRRGHGAGAGVRSCAARPSATVPDGHRDRDDAARARRRHAAVGRVRLAPRR